MRFLRAPLIAVSLIPVAAFAATPDVVGPVYPIKEQDIVAWMKERAGGVFTPEKLAQLQAERTKATREYADNPPGLSLPRTKEATTHWFDPSVTVPYDLRDHEGRIIHPAGTTINPLQWRSLTRKLVFLDGTDESQVKWAEDVIASEQEQVKLILIAGSPTKLSHDWKIQVYFDQDGFLAEKLSIKQVPAMVSQDGNRLRVDEVMP